MTIAAAVNGGEPHRSPTGLPGQVDNGATKVCFKPPSDRIVSSRQRFV